MVKNKEADKQHIKEQMERFHKGGIEGEIALIEIMDENAGLIGHVIDKHFPSYKPKYYEDMYSCGKVGLLTAIGKYDVEKSKPTTYFTYYILHEIYEFTRGFVSGASAQQTRDIKKVAEALQLLENEGITDPSPEQVAEKSGLSDKAAKTAMRIRIASQNKDYIDSSYLDSLLSEREIFSMDTAEIAAQNMEQKALMDALGTLTEEEQIVIICKYGLYNGKVMRHTDISKETHIPVEKVRLLANSGMKKLRHDNALRKVHPDYSEALRQSIINNDVATKPSKRKIQSMIDDLDDLM